MYDFKDKDRLLKYFEPFLKSFLFLELKDEFWEGLGLDKLGKGVSVPILPHNLKEFEDGGLSLNHFADNMIFVAGASPNFKFSDSYCAIVRAITEGQADQYIMSRAMNLAREGEFVKACVYFRAGILLCNDRKLALLNYAKACKEVYAKSDDSDEIGNFKAESLSVMEELTIEFPDFDEPYYFLGYFYLNMGLYLKASLAWEKYLSMTTNNDGIMEISSRLKEVAEPRKIEEAANKVIAGRYQEGYVELLPYLSSDYNTWWPLHFYLATASEELGNYSMAEERYKNTLRLQPSLIDAVDGLIRVYRALGEEEKAYKYEQKKEIISKNFSE